MKVNPPDLSMAERVDRACDQFEADWRSGKRPRIEDVLGSAEGEQRSKLLRGILLVELELLAATGETPSPDDYRRRFPQHVADIEWGFAEAAQGVDNLSQAEKAAATISLGTPSIDTSKIGEAPSHPAQAALPETLGRFRILEVLGEGAFGVVCKAHDPQLDREVAIKVPRESALQGAADRQRFLREARAAAGLSHPNICRVHEVGEATGRDYIVMELLAGKPLSAFIECGKVQSRQAAIVVRKLALALHDAHAAGIVHRDLKPANIMINSRGEPIIMDFGLARLNRPGDAQLTASGVIMGSPAYMSPEQARGATDEIGPTADIYSLGVILYELLCGRRPFEGTVTEVIGQILHVEPAAPSQHKPGIDPALEAICLKAMAKQPGRRYGSMKELAQALSEYLKKSGSSGAPVTITVQPGETLDQNSVSQPGLSALFEAVAAQEQTQALHHRNLTLLVAGGLVAAVLVLGGILFFARTPMATVIINVDVNLQDPELKFVLDDRLIPAAALAVPVELNVGEHELIVYRGAQLERRFAFEVKGGKKPGIAITEDSGPPGLPGIVLTPGKWIPLLEGENPLKTWKVETKHSENRFEFSPGRLKFNGFVSLSPRIVANNYIVRSRLKQAGGGVPKLGGHGVVGVGGNHVHAGPDGQVYLSKETVEGTDFKLLGKGRAEFDEEGFIDVALAFHNGKMQVYSGGKLLIESDDDEYRGGHTSVVHFNPKGWNLGDGEVRDLQICVLNGTELTPQEALKRLITPATVDPAAERRFAQWVRDKRGELGIQAEDREHYYRHDSTEPLPAGPFRVTSIRLSAQHTIQDADLAPLSGLTELKTVNLHHNPHFGPDALRPLRDLAKMENLLLFGDPGLGNAALEHILHLRGLKVLHIQRTGITDAGVERIAGAFPELRELNLSQNDITDAALAHVPTFPELKQLILGVTGVSDKGLVHLAGLQLTKLDLGQTKVTDAGLVHLKAMASLEQLRIVDVVEISDAGVEHLLGLKGLKQLTIWNTKITEEGLSRLHEGLPGCRIDTQPP